ncbi:MAG: PEGA domain-containing protein [Phycisphaeraceae bacterium]|nr:PEGA domain-containing protein [Phycisphaeraceae bacterium]
MVAIFFKNRAGKAYVEKVSAFEDLLSAKLSDRGFSILSREDVANSVAGFAGQGANAGDPNQAGADLDALLSNNTSALRLAQSMNADYILTASIVSINHNKKRFEGYGVDTTVFESVMQSAYKILDRNKGGSVAGGTAKSTFKSPYRDMKTENGLQTQMNVYAEQVGAVDELLDDASTQLAKHFERKDPALAPVAATGMVNWGVICGAANITVPTVVKTASGDFVIGEQPLPLNPMNVIVELNGVVVGTAPGVFQVPPGLSKMRLSREGYKDIERTVNVVPGQTLRIDLQMTDAEYLRWKDMTGFLEQLKVGSKLSDAQAEQIRGYAQMLRQSGYKVDVKTNVDIQSDLKGIVQTSLWR